ncbi:HlyD family efflux transporter periplasmic adaptor subunit [Chamaesiphon sp. OTE_20_metabat_361]|uniref:HlyD family efflux transporter periplasmic adaptor subunit n=1 Tax=Chamaesiphon sp. OTE_20_metabat_361 TaxID=2964689 RepID=UPI00286B0113|nr:HlyD family efflux transporter periplasmic adaptor subunit [Chamaesiphon sp. OTE_20_metabat_361]
MKPDFALTICGLVVLLGGCTSGIAQQSPQPVIPAKPNAVVALGRIQPEGEVIKLSVANAQDSRVDRILIKEGDFVKRDRIIAILQGIDRKQADLRDALADVKLRELELSKIVQGGFKNSQIVAQTAAISRLQAQLTSARQQQQAVLNSAQAQLQNALANDLRQASSTKAGLGLLTARAKLANAEAEYRRRSQFDRSGYNTLGLRAKFTNARTEYQRKLTLYRSGGISKSQLDKAQEEFTSAQALLQERQIDTKTQLDKATEELAAATATLQEKKLEIQSQSGRISTELATVRQTVKEKQAELNRVIHTLTAEIQQEQAKLAELREVRPTDVRIAQAQLDKAKIAVEQKQAALRDSEVRVPVDGQILKINTRVGEQVNTAQGIVELAQTTNMYVIAEVAEIDINRIYQGQPAVVTSEYNSFAGSLQGTVAQIGLQVGRKQSQEASGNNPATDKDSRIVAVKIKIAPQDTTKVAKLTNLQVRVRLPSKS